jgi:hypothetical protein
MVYPQRTTYIRRSLHRLRVHSLRAHSLLRCHSIHHHRWSPLTHQRHPYHPHLHHPRVPVPVASSRSTSRTGAKLPSYQISYRRRRSQHGTKSSRLTRLSPRRSSGRINRFGTADTLQGLCDLMRAFILVSTVCHLYTYGRVCRILYMDTVL